MGLLGRILGSGSGGQAPRPKTDAERARFRERQVRLAVEFELVKKYFPSFAWKNPAGPTTYVEGELETNANHRYSIQLVLDENFPVQAPKVYITSKIRSPHSKSLLIPSHDMHTLLPDGSNPQICHTPPSGWTPDMTLHFTLVKARLWLEAFEFHCKTGNPISSFVKPAAV